MVFSSLVFLSVFLPTVLIAYYISPRYLRNMILMIASLIFYAWGEPVYIGIMIFSTVFDYANGILIDRYRKKRGVARTILIASMAVNLGMLCFFKYYGFIADNINRLLNLNIAIHKLPLPLGISFYTFQTMSYVIDVYMGKVKVQRNIISFGTYITMFPQLVAGPIVRYGDVLNQLDARRENFELFGEGVERFITGMGKKVLLANNIGLLWRSVKGTPIGELSVLSAWLGIIAFTFQIYFDFSGYSDMAIGLGKMFGFDFLENFNYPYISQSITEFWRRWHISLSSWFREYVYIPLGGNRCGKLKQYKNLIIVWFLTGLWHGANWNFIFWGIYFGFFIALEKLILLRLLEKCHRTIRHLYSMLIVIIGWVFFEFDSLLQGFHYVGVMFGLQGRPLYDSDSIYYLYTNGILFILLIICSTPVVYKLVMLIKKRLNGMWIIAMTAANILLMFLCTAYLVNESYNPFLYFRF